MKKFFKSKITVILMLLVMVFATMCAVLPAYAASTTIKVSDITAKPGETISVDVSISGNTGFGSGKFTLEYDSSVLTLTKIDKKGKILSGATVNEKKGLVSFASAVNEEENGVLFTAVFEVKEDAPNNVYVVSVKVEDMLNAETKEPLSLTVKKGSVNVHLCGNAQYVEETPASCSKEGTKAHYLCSCGKTYSDKDCTKAMSSVTISKKSHSYGAWEVVKEPTCTAKGQRKRTCKDCDYVATSSISAKGHDWSEWVVTKPVTDTENGEQTRKCSVCNKVETREVVGHNFGEWIETKAPTCTEMGEETRTCTDEGCGEVETREIMALGHSCSEWTVVNDATCTAVGTESGVCLTCQSTVTREIPVNPDNHVYGEWTVSKEASCGVKGEETRVCSCGEKETRETEALTHEWEWVVDEEATKSRDGFKHEECKNCGKIRNEGTVIEKTGNGMLVFWIVLIIILLIGIGIVVAAFIYKRRLAAASAAAGAAETTDKAE